MREFRSLILIYITLLFYIPFNLFSQTSDLASNTRGARVVAKDNQTGQEKIVNLYRKVYGVIIGIDLYINLAPDRQLRYAVRDAKGIEKLLKERFIFDEITALYNREASREAIMSTLLGRLSQTESDDAVFIFFAGHGYTDTTQYGELGYLIPYDGSFEKRELYKNISMTQLKEEVGKAIPAKHIFFMIDACYSGLLVMRGSSPETHRDLNYMQKITKEPVRQILTAGAQDEEVLDGGPLGHSVFVGRILQILDETSDFITASELSITIKEKVFSDARGMGHIQTPAFGAFFGLGDFVFIPRPDTRYEEIRAEISKLQSQLEEIDKQKKEAEKIKSEKEIREAKRKEEDILAKLKIEQLEQERLQKEKERKVMLEEEEKRMANEEAQKKIEIEAQKKLEEEELKQLRQKLVEEESKLKDSRKEIMTIESAKKELIMLEEKISEVTSLISAKKEKELNRLEIDFKPLKDKIANLNPVKDQFETTSAFKIRVEKYNNEREVLNNKYNSEYQEIENKFATEIASRIKVYKERLNELKNRKYPAEGLKIELLTYNADKQLYKAKIIDESTGIEWYYSIMINPEMAKELYNKRELIKFECNYINLDDRDSLTDVNVYEPISIKLTLIPSKHLRFNYLTSLSLNEARDMMKYFNSMDDLNSQFEIREINGDKVVLDITTRLIWHQSSALEVMTGLEAEQWINLINKKGYAGFHDWRLPTLEEGASLLAKSRNDAGLYIDPVFSSNQEFIWSGDFESHAKLWEWGINFLIGKVEYRINMGKKNCYVLPVRSGLK